MVAPVLLAEEFQLDEAGVGVKLNGDVAMPFVDLTTIQGLDSSQPRLQTTQREGYDGAWIDSSFEQERTVILEGMLYASNTALETYLDSLKANWAVSKIAKPLYFGTDAGMRVVFGKPQGVRYSKETIRRTGGVSVQFSIVCGDPLVYTPTLITQNLPGTVAVGGNRPTPPVIRINGSRTNPTLTLNGKTLILATTIPGGSYIDIDVANRRVLLNGTSNYRLMLAFTTPLTGWNEFMLNPGNNTFTVGGTGSGTITLTARSAWR